MGRLAETVERLWQKVSRRWRKETPSTDALEAVPIARPAAPIEIVSDDDRWKRRNRRKLATEFLEAMNLLGSRFESQCAKSLQKQFSPMAVSMCGEVGNVVNRFDVGLEARFSYRTGKPDHMRNVDISWMQPITEENCAGRFNEEMWCVSRVRRVGFRSLRGRFYNVPSGCVFFEYTETGDHVAKHGLVQSWIYLTADNGQTWHVMWNEFLEDRRRLRRPPRVETRIRPCIDTWDDPKDQGFEYWKQLRPIEAIRWCWEIDRSAWRVRLARRDCVLEFHANEAICREMISVRNSGGERRPAALHWVKDHERILPDGRSTTVRAHLRGKTEFEWADWNVEIRPAAYDLEALPSGELPTMDVGTRTAALQ